MGASGNAIDGVVAAHDTLGLALGHSDAKGRPIGIHEREVGDNGIEVVARCPIAVLKAVCIPIYQKAPQRQGMRAKDRKESNGSIHQPDS